MRTVFFLLPTHMCIYMQVLFLHTCIWLVVFTIGHLILGTWERRGLWCSNTRLLTTSSIGTSSKPAHWACPVFVHAVLEGRVKSGNTNADIALERHPSVLECSILLWGVAVSHCPG